MVELSNDYSQSAEEKIRIKAATNGIRVHEFFHDFDRLRSGYVTKNQFKRLLDQHFNVLLTKEEEDSLFAKYNFKGDQINYREFCNSINKFIQENNLSVNPENVVFKNPEYLGTFRSTQFLDDKNMNELENLLTNLSSYFKKNGIDVLTNFHDYDKTNTGAVTESQFYRGLTEPKLTDEQLILLINKYRDPEKPGKVNYMNLHYDILAFIKNGEKNESKTKSDIFFESKNLQHSIREILDKILLASHKNGIRISEFFRDYDRLRSGAVTEHQFICAVSLAVEKQANLSRNDINKLVEFYRQKDGKCYYRDFTTLIENAFNEPELEKMPTVVVSRPVKGALARAPNSVLSPEENEAVQVALDKISEKIKKRRLQIFPYFKDFDRSKAFSRSITKIQFGRVLSMIDLMPNANEFRLLCDKFEDKISGDINYPAFCHAVDDEFIAYTANCEAKIEESKKEPEFKVDTSSVNYNDLIARIRHHVLVNRIRIKEFFEDMDPLRSARISKTRFLRCLSSLGISSIGALNLNKAQLEVLCNKYEVLNDKTKVDWRKFESDIESVFTLNGLERDPNLRVPPAEIFEMPPAGTVDIKNATASNLELYNEVVEKWRRKIQQRRLDCWPPFKDFDKLNRGHVTARQFRQSLAILDLLASEDEMTAVEAIFMNDIGFNYVKLLTELQPKPVERPKYTEFSQEMAQLSANKVLEEFRPATTVNDTLNKIKNQVLKKRVRLYEWLRDHDKLNSGRLPTATFRRALDLCNLELREAEYDLLEDHYKSQKNNKEIEYKKFCNEIESIFTDSNFEKNPLLEPRQYMLEKTVTKNTLHPDDEDLVLQSLKKLAERVKRYRLQLFPKFEDFDRVKNGYVSQNQFRRVLSDLDLGSLLSELEFMKMCEKFRVLIGSRDDIDYCTLCDTIYFMCGFEYRKP